MRYVVTIASLLLSAVSASAQVQWVTGNRVSVPAGSPTNAPGIFVSTASNVTFPKIALPPGQWHTIDLADGPQWGTWQPDIPSTTVGVELAGILIVTNATNTSTPTMCDVHVTFRQPGSLLASGNYQMQAIAVPGDGARSNATVTVPVINKKFEFFWTFAPICGVLPSAVAINLTVQKVIWSEAGTTVTPMSPAPSTTTVPEGGRWFRICNTEGCFEGYLLPG